MHFNFFCLCKTNKFHVAVRLFSNRSQRTSKCGKNISDSFLFLPHFDVICDLLLNGRTATWNVFVKWTNRRCWRIEATEISSLQAFNEFWRNPNLITKSQCYKAIKKLLIPQKAGVALGYRIMRVLRVSSAQIPPACIHNSTDGRTNHEPIVNLQYG